jgi:hypothetical protein
VNNDPVNWVDLWGLDTLTIHNLDPTSDADIIVSNDGKVGYTWLEVNNNHLGFGYADGGDPVVNRNISGAVLRTETENTQQGMSNGSYTKEITPEQATKINNFFNSLETNNKSYDLGGSSVYPNATMCTEAAINALNYAGALTPAEAVIINREYRKWSDSIPAQKPQGFEQLAENTKNLRAPNPNEMAVRLTALNGLNCSSH